MGGGLGEGGQPLVEGAGGDALFPGGEGAADGGGEFVDGAAGFGGDVDADGPGDALEFAVDLLVEVEPAVGVDQVPLVEGDDQRAAGLDDLGEDALVLFADDLAGVQQDDGDLGGLDGAGGPRLPGPTC